jgi:hypothetical protein
MRAILMILISGALVTAAFGEVSQPRTIADIPEARVALQRGVSPKFYKSLLVSPIKGWVTVRGQLTGNHLTATKLVRSDLNGEFDSLAMELANNLHIHAYNQPTTLSTVRNVLLHVLIYQCADGKLAISFSNFEEAGGTQLKYTGAAWMAVLKRNHLWETIDPLQLAPRERRGPRAYTIAAEAPGQTRLPRAAGYPSLTTR